MNINCNPSLRVGLFRSLCRLVRLFLAFGMLLFALSAQALDKPYPVIFVHGINSNSEDSWGNFRRMLVENGWVYGGATRYEDSSGTVKVWQGDPADRKDLKLGSGHADFYTVNFSNNHDLTFPEQGAELAKIISAVLAANPTKNKVILVAHSMGGLAARAYLQGQAGTAFRDDVQQLITVGTPNQGSMHSKLCGLSDFKLWLCAYENLNPESVANQSLIPGSAALDDLNKAATVLNQSSVQQFVSIVVDWIPTLTEMTPNLLAATAYSSKRSTNPRLVTRI